ncbi:hypothetical protein CPC08DRAFT_729533 [Agrocybe pediades]|nr:hypothetical protein CPC08DRAFT_729533 [Agrocybe pediades]
MTKWTKAERKAFQTVMRSFSRWEVDFVHNCVKATKCEGQTVNDSSICDECQSIARDKSLLHAIRKKENEAKLPADERQEIFSRRKQYARNNHILQVENQRLQELLADPVLFDIHTSLKTGKPEDCFLQLFKQAREGKLETSKRFLEVCEIFSDRVRCETSGNRNLKYGIRYSESYLNFMIAMRGYGQNSNRQYSIFTAEFNGPSVRHLRTLVSSSENALQNPYLIFDNMAHVKRYVDSIKYKGPIIVGSDCTKVRKRLNYSTQHGSHILGTIFPLHEVEVDNQEDIDEIVNRAMKEKAHATQARAIIAKIPLPGSAPIVIALLPTSGKEDASEIHGHHMKLQAMAQTLSLPLVAFGADGAAVELAAQVMMDKEQSQEEPFTYEYPLYGISLKVPVFQKTGPVVSITDPPHAKKTCRNQPQYGTHTASLGVGYLVNRSLVDLYHIPGSGLVFRDVDNVDKQDDGAARRVFHSNALNATIIKEDNDLEAPRVRPGFEGIFAYLFVMGTLFEAWMNPCMKLHDRVTAALRARFWLHCWHRHITTLAGRYPDLYSTSRSFISAASFQIFNRLCDTLVILALVFSVFYPTIPFCPWLFGTEFVEHFFGIARQLLPNFSYAEFLKMVQHIMVRQRILESGLLKSKRERDSAVGYMFDASADMRKVVNDSSATSALEPSNANLTRDDLGKLVEVAYTEATYICRDILHIPVPRLEASKPLELRPLGAPALRKPVEVAALEDPLSETEDTMSDIEEDDVEQTSEVTTSEPQHDTDSVDAVATIASSDTAQYSALCEDLDTILQEAQLTEEDIVIPKIAAPLVPLVPGSESSYTSIPPSSSAAVTSTISQATRTGPVAITSALVDVTTSTISVSELMKYRGNVQSGTTAKSERSVVIQPKYTLRKVLDATSTPITAETPAADSPETKFNTKEASHRLRVAQELNTELKKVEVKKMRQIRWETAAKSIETLLTAAAALKAKKATSTTSRHVQSALPGTALPPSILPNIKSKNVTPINPLQLGNYLIMRTERRYYIGQILDIYKRGSSSRYGSIASTDNLQSIAFLSLRVFLALQVQADDSDEESDSEHDDKLAPDFSSIGGAHKYHLHTHAPSSTVVYHLGCNALVGDHPSRKSLTPLAASHWNAVQSAKSILAKEVPLTIHIPGGKMPRKL